MARKKITATTDNSEWKAPKKRKPRKPMTDEQKAAASERLAKAREARAHSRTSVAVSLPPSVATLRDADPPAGETREKRPSGMRDGGSC